MNELENAILGNFLTEWDSEQSFNEIFKEGNESTIVWEPYEYWELDTLKNHIKEIIKSVGVSA